MSPSNDGFFRNVSLYILSRRKFFVILFVFLLIISYIVFGKKGILQRVEMELENRNLEKKVRVEEERSLLLQKEIELLKTSEKKIEQLAREKYGMVKDGEELYKVVIDSTK